MIDRSKSEMEKAGLFTSKGKFSPNQERVVERSVTNAAGNVTNVALDKGSEISVATSGRLDLRIEHQKKMRRTRNETQSPR